MSIKFCDKYLKSFICENDYNNIQPKISKAHSLLTNKSGEGAEFLGWVDLPNRVNFQKNEIERMKTAANKIQQSCNVFVVIGIGGSYLGARAAIEFVKGTRYNTLKNGTPEIYFAGNDINPSTISEILEICDNKDVCINVISKSGTTTEPAIAFRIFREMLEFKYGKGEAKERIFVTTDVAKGKLKELSDNEGYETFVVPDDVGGRFSVLSPVGLLPIAVSGIDIDEILDGAISAKNLYTSDKVSENDCYKYAAARNILLEKGKLVEVLAYYDNALQMTAEWWKQLFGESEGKDKKGIFPASVGFTTDLHSLGQFIQDGTRIMFETVIDLQKSNNKVVIPYDDLNSDGINFIANKDMHDVNRTAFEATAIAHTKGGVPNIILELNSRTAFDFGHLAYFFELSCAISGYVLGVNPFNQPGVEEYKRNMFALLGKSGTEYDRIRKNLI